MDRIRVLIVDDSAFMRHALGRLLGETPSLEVVGAASNGAEGLQMAQALSPDVITLDVEMPVMTGLEMLERLMAEKPTRVVMLSSVTTEGAKVTFDALDAGAIDFVSKPSGSLSIDIGRVGAELVAKIHAAAAMPEAVFLRHRQIAAMNNASRLAQRKLAALPQPAAGPTRDAATGMSQDAAARGTAGRGRPIALPGQTTGPWIRRVHRAPHSSADAGPRLAARQLVVIASSTGGPGALSTLVRGLPDRLGAAVVIVQHMPAGFTASLAARLDSLCPLPCAEGSTDAVLVEDEILVAPGDMHLIATSRGHVQLVRLPPVNGVRPAADVTLEAVAPIYRNRLLCVVLTGMGCDGRDGARKVKQQGGTVFAQDQATSTIYGMPAAVAEAGLADRVLPLTEIGAAIGEWCAANAQQLPPAAGLD